MNKILIALVLVVVMNGNAFSSDTLHFYCDPKIWERNYKKNKIIAYGFRIIKGEYNFKTGKTESDFAEQIFLNNNAKFSQEKREVKFDPYFITLRNKSGYLVTKIDRTTLKFDESYLNKDCEVVDSWFTLKNKLSKKQKKIEEVRRKNLKF